MLSVPTDKRELITFANELVTQCRVSVGVRASYCRLMNTITETGRYDGNKSLINMLYKHLDRTASHLFSPVELKFSVDYDRVYPKQFIDRAGVVATQLTRDWARNSTDTLFGRGVFEALKYGGSILKQWVQVEGLEERPCYNKKLLLPWQFGVYNESENDIMKQPAMCETTRMTLPEVWQRLAHLPDARKLYERIKSHACKGNADAASPDSYFNQVLSTAVLDVGVNGGTNVIPGGVLQIGQNANMSVITPQVAADTVQFHELWVQDEKDYTTIQLIEPDIIVAPIYKKMNLLGVKRQHPYRLIQPNEVTNWFWGRSELVDLVEPQMLLSLWADDIKRLFGLQIDKIIAFMGEDGISDEKYAQMRQAGYFGLGANSKIQDLTPQMPPNAMQMLEFVIDIINNLAGFPDIMQGRGEAGVRAGSHASTLMKTASPTLRDRALLVERQCAVAAALSLAIKQAKDPQKYWTNADSLEEIEKTSFLLTDIPEDWRVGVDSHSSSPIFSDENQNLVFASHKSGIVTSDYVIDTLPYPNKEQAKAMLKDKEAAGAAQTAQIMKQYPALGEKMAEKRLVGGRG